jgi:ubiquinone biosynthesis protein
MNPAKNLKELGQQIPDLLLGAQDLPNLLIDSVNGLKNQAVWHDRQIRELQTLRLQVAQQQRRNWIFGSIFIFLLSIAMITPIFIGIIFYILAALVAIWRAIN